MTLGNSAAFARPIGNIQSEEYNDDQEGLSKREYFAAMAMRGLLASGKYDQTYSDISDAAHYADALIAALNQENA